MQVINIIANREFPKAHYYNSNSLPKLKKKKSMQGIKISLQVLKTFWETSDNMDGP